MNITKKVFIAPAVLAAALAGCASDGGYYSSAPSSNPSYSQVQGSPRGYVERIEVVNRGSGSNIAGTVIGGIVGGLIGTQIGSGSGRTAATIAGAAGGAIAGNTIEGRRRGDNETFRVSVRLDDGSTRVLMQDDLNDLQTGDRVRVVGSRVVRI